MVLSIRLRFNFRPDRLGDLEVVPLMSGEIDQCRLPRKAEIGGDGIGPNSFFTLTVEIAPEGLIGAASVHAAEWVSFRRQPALRIFCTHPINPRLGCFHALKTVHTSICGLKLIVLR